MSLLSTFVNKVSSNTVDVFSREVESDWSNSHLFVVVNDNALRTRVVHQMVVSFDDIWRTFNLIDIQRPCISSASMCWLQINAAAVGDASELLQCYFMLLQLMLCCKYQEHHLILFIDMKLHGFMKSHVRFMYIEALWSQSIRASTHQDQCFVHLSRQLFQFYYESVAVFNFCGKSVGELSRSVFAKVEFNWPKLSLFRCG